MGFSRNRFPIRVGTAHQRPAVPGMTTVCAAGGGRWPAFGSPVGAQVDLAWPKVTGDQKPGKIATLIS